MRSGNQIIWALALLAAAISLWAADGKAAAAALKALTAAPTRVVWCQDAGDGTDAGVQSDRLRLMGFDTEDRRGERPILPRFANYAKPLLTPRGDRVIFSNRRERKIFAVNWDGSGPRTVTDGFALAVWEDPLNSNVWVYAGTAAGDTTALRNIRRHRLDQPAMSEPVWDKTPVEIDNFQLAANGRLASANYPWPVCGVLELPNGATKKLGDGCWPSLAPDNSYRFWLFDGAHRNLTLCDPVTDRRWVVNINQAPGIGGFEVYHPRWSSHPRFMTMTGPYIVGDRDNRIRGGGAGVEIYIGRFSADFRKIDQWVRVTHNTNADFFPDVWIEGGRQAGVLIPAAPQTAAPEPVPAKIPKPAVRLVVMARPVELSRIPTPASIAPYRRALVVNRYNVEEVVAGNYRTNAIMVAHWAIRDSRVLPGAVRDKGCAYRLVLEPFDEHPELEGERLIMDGDEFRLPLYYEAER